MKTIFKIAKTELQTLFYSPIAWLILIIFTFQCSMAFSDLMGGMVRSNSLGYGNYNVTGGLFDGWRGLFVTVQSYLYLYIPLLTMSLMSREFGSGSIKLLYSSPVTNWQIILGKYASMMVYALVLIGVLMLYAIYAICAAKNIDIPYILSGLLGLYLLICAYAAIGLFMSSLTSYQIVAAVGTLAVLAALSYVKGLWQEIDFVRDLTFWLAIDGRAGEFVDGLICSEDVIYFLIVILLFLSMAVIRLQARRQKSSWMVNWGKYVGVWAVALFIGYLSSRPSLMSFYDATRTKHNTLTQNSQDIVARMDGKLTITTYVNIMDRFYWYGSPSSRNWDLERFKQYVRFKPDITMKYVYYYDSIKDMKSLEKRYPDMTFEEMVKKTIEIIKLDSNKILKPEQIREQIDLKPEMNRFVRLLERENGQKTFLRVFDDMMVFPGETEISAAFKRLVMKLPKVGFLTGHGERNTERQGDRDYSSFTQDKPFRYSLINQGFDFENVTLDKTIPEDVNILVIAEMRQPLTAEEQANLDNYIARGGNLFIVGEPKRQEIMNPVIEQFGVQFMPGVLVRPTENFQADLIVARPTKEAADFSYIYNTMRRRELVITMPSATGLDYTTDKGFEVTPLFVSDTINCWNELQTTNFVDDTARFDPSTGEIQKTFVTGLALSRKVGEKEQKIMIFGDADCVSNGEFSRSRKDIPASNYSIIQGAFFWLSDEEVPIDVRRPRLTDDKVYVGETGMYITKIGFMGVLPAILLFIAIFIWIRRRGR
ncbi:MULTISPECIES: Gldg family protein [Porphyromonadaceae]|uniref:ABC transporter n=3 Tax=Sanguibacteroides TaxID=1635148 RepID=A0A0C3NIL0_9PORP|nr:MULTISPECIES: Gldg family protein [Porphyromonadaceae]KIO46007.1 ABC transporter [Sanguibacteroides justesenii]PXZ44870.1 ABC transporter [Sanguibacteroides justesenii]